MTGPMNATQLKIEELLTENERLKQQLTEIQYMTRIMNFYRNLLAILISNPAMPRMDIIKKVKETQQYVRGVEIEWKRSTEPPSPVAPHLEKFLIKPGTKLIK